MSELAPNDLRALRGEAAVTLSMQDESSANPIDSAARAFASIMHFAESAGIHPAFLIEGAMTLYAFQRINMTTEESIHQANPDAFDKPFVPRPEALALLKQRLAELD